MKKLYIIPVILLYTGIATAQNESDVLRFSRTSNLGTARSAAMGGAFSALGGDLSNLSSNPAGVGVFRKSEVGLTLNANFGNTKSGNRSSNDNSFQMGDLGGVISFYNPNFDWRGFNFAINYTNINNFNRNTKQFVYNSPTSFSQALANETNYIIDNFEKPDEYLGVFSQMAIESNVILANPETPYYEPVIIGAHQYKNIKEDGYQGEYSFSFGTNYKDKLYLGMSIGIQSIYYKSNVVYRENPDKDNPYSLDYFDYMEKLKTTGVGTNFKFGVIYRPIPEVRLGASIHTPTYYSMTDNYGVDMYSKYNIPDPEGYYDYISNPYRYKTDYDLKTPWKAILGAAVVLKQRAIISMDYEYVNYTSARLSDGPQGYDYYEPNGTGTNDNVKNFLKATHNFRVGAEFRMNSMLSLRGGYSYNASPYKYATDLYKLQTISGGFGLNFGMFYCDAAYVYKFTKDITQFYSYVDPDDAAFDVSAIPVKNKFNDHEARITVGVRF